LSVARHKTQTETTTQPLQRGFSSVDILPCIARQKINEWEGGMHARQLMDDQLIGTEAGRKNWKASAPAALFTQTLLSGMGDLGRVIRSVPATIVG